MLLAAYQNQSSQPKYARCSEMYSMTDNEQRRASEQRRIEDIVAHVEDVKMSARGQMLLIIIGACGFFGGIVIWMSAATTKDIIRPLSDEQIRLRADVDFNRSMIRETKESVDDLRVELKAEFKEIAKLIKEGR